MGTQSKLLGSSNAQSYVDYKPTVTYANQTYTNGTGINGTAMSKEHCLAICYQNLCGGWITYNSNSGLCVFRGPQANPANLSVSLRGTALNTFGPPQATYNNNLTAGSTCFNETRRQVNTPGECLNGNMYGGNFTLYTPATRLCQDCRFQQENGTDFLIGLSPPTTRSVVKPWLPFADVSAKNQLDGAIIALEYDGKYVVANLNGDLGYVDKTWRYGETTGLDVATKFQITYSTVHPNYFNIVPLFNPNIFLQYGDRSSAVRWTLSSGVGQNDAYALFGVDVEGTPLRISRITPADALLPGNFQKGQFLVDSQVARAPVIGSAPIIGGANLPGRTGGILPMIIETSPYVKAYTGVRREECCFGTYPANSTEYKICEDLKVTPDSKTCIGPDITHGVTGVIAEYCSAHIGDDQRCLTFCKDKKVDCDNLIETYCQRIGPESAAGSDICGCFRGVDFYENFFNQLKSNVSISTVYPDFPQCYYKRCATSNWQNYRTKSLGSQCPNITSCIIVNEFNNVTGDIGSVTIEQTNECKSVQQNITPVTPVTGQVTLTSVEPDYGPPAGGTTVTINGSNFELGATVTIGGKVATSTWVSATKFTAVTPSGTGTVNISITNPESSTGNLPNAFSYSTTPVLKVTTLKPGSGPAGTVITLTGSNFQTGATVYFGDIIATNTKVNSLTQITTTVPAGSGRVDVIVENTGGQSFTLPQSFVYSTKPSLPKKGIPWWVWLLLAIFILLIFIAILSVLRRKRARARKLATALETPVLGSQFGVGF